VTVGGAQGAASPLAVPAGRRRLRPRLLWLVPGLAIAILAGEIAKKHGVGIVELIGFGVAPHLPLLLRYTGSAGAASIAVPGFNLLHNPLVAFAAVAVVAAAVVIGIVPMVAVVATLVWFSHIVIGWGLGDVIRHQDSN
jgi:hypothetical protein